jgi:hypothetical protein
VVHGDLSKINVQEIKYITMQFLPQRKQRVTMTKINWLMMFKEIIFAGYFLESYETHKYTQCAKCIVEDDSLLGYSAV